MTHEEFMMLPYEQRCELDLCKSCIHQDICDSYMQIDCECYIKADPEDSVVLSMEEYEEVRNALLQAINAYNQGCKDTASELINHLKRRRIIGEYELNRLAEQYGVKIKE